MTETNHIYETEVNMIMFNRIKLERLKRAYDQAVYTELETFIFERTEYDVGYVKYLIEYLTRRFEQ